MTPIFINILTTSAVFSVKATSSEDTFGNGNTYVAYCFADIAGTQKIGTYEGGGVADGTMVYTGFRPAFVMTKSIDSTSHWAMFEKKREGQNPNNDALWADGSNEEQTADQIDFLSNGFKLRIATDPNVAETYVYYAFAEQTFKFSNAK